MMFRRIDEGMTTHRDVILVATAIGLALVAGIVIGFCV